jgi:hypothetical protein
MGPLKKRLKGPKGEAALPSVAPQATAPSPLPSVSEIHSLFQSLTKQLQDGSTDKRKMQIAVLQLKAWQRQLYSRLSEQQTEWEDALREQNKRRRSELAEDYLVANLQAEIDQCKRQPEMTQLERLARQELLEEESETCDQDASSIREDRTSLLQRYLPTNDITNPADKQAIVDFLHQELQDRDELDREVQALQSELNTVQRELQVQTDLLNLVPVHLSTLERASQPLAKLFGNFRSSPAAGISSLASKERLQRFEAAQQLPPPLYTLFTLLQHGLDEQLVGETGSQGGALSVAGASNHQLHHEVVLQLAVPDVTSSSKKRVSIHFRYDDKTLPLVTARAAGCPAKLNQELLLDELFPGDDGCEPLQQREQAAESDSAEASSKRASSAVVGKPYHWCNVLAGLYYPTAATESLKASTRVVLRELVRRIRSNSCLKHIVHSLQRQHVPVPPSAASSKATGCTLTQFDVTQGEGKTEKTFAVTLRKGQKHQLNALVRLHMSRYPAVPPVWTLNVDKDSSGDAMNNLYDSRFARFERKVNVEALERKVDPEEDSKGTESAKVDEEASYCDWILVHQLRTIMQEWDSWLTVLDNEETSDKKDGATPRAGRMHKGRDRVLLES